MYFPQRKRKRVRRFVSVVPLESDGQDLVKFTAVKQKEIVDSYRAATLRAEKRKVEGTWKGVFCHQH